jgi:uncharacterized Fe-S center protein
MVDAYECTACGTCADERCPMEAVEIIDDIAVVDQEKCIGCGLCVSTCPAEAITLLERSERPEISPTVKEMSAKILTEKGKLSDFIKLMKK